MIRRITTRPARLARHSGPLAWRRERGARTAIGMAARHPERITGELGRPQEDWLAAVAAGLWPDDEYTEIIRGTPPGSRGDGR